MQGGESVALARLADQLSDKGWVAAFEKPKGDPSAFIKPATTMLSPHLKFGTLSCRLFFVRLQQVRAGGRSEPGAPVRRWRSDNPTAFGGGTLQGLPARLAAEKHAVTGAVNGVG